MFPNFYSSSVQCKMFGLFSFNDFWNIQSNCEGRVYQYLSLLSYRYLGMPMLFRAVALIAWLSLTNGLALYLNEKIIFILPPPIQMGWHLYLSSFILFFMNYLPSIKGPSSLVLWIPILKDLHPSITLSLPVGSFSSAHNLLEILFSF